MRRRALLALLGLAPFAGSTRARDARPVLARLSTGTAASTAPFNQAFLDGMRELDLLEDRDFAMVYRFAEGYRQRLPALAEEIVRLSPAVIIPSASVETVAVRAVTHGIPIVTPALADPEELGLIASESHPGSNVTGIQPYVPGLPAKQFELAFEVMGGRLRRLGVLSDREDPKAPPQLHELEASGRRKGIEVVQAEAKIPDDLRGALDRLQEQQVDIVIVLQTSMLFNARRLISELANARRLPTVYGYREHVVDGGLISYGVDLRACFRLAAGYVKKILDGANAGDLPIQFPTSLHLVVNARTARLLGIALSPMLLARTDEVID